MSPHLLTIIVFFHLENDNFILYKVVFKNDNFILFKAVYENTTNYISKKLLHIEPKLQ